MKFFGLTFILLSLLSSCASVNSISLTQVPEKRVRRISASVDRLIILALNFDNDYVDDLEDKLKSKCQNGRIEGVFTKDETKSYVFWHIRKVTATGYCLS